MNQLDKKTFDQTGLHQIRNCDKSNRKADVIFVHGLTGHAITTWHPNDKCDEECWPFWLGDENEFEDIGIWSFGYKANRFGSSMSIYEQAISLLENLSNEAQDYGIGKQPLIFITHSLGGLVIKETLNIAHTNSPNPTKKALIEQVKGVVFLATPHQGSNVANIFENLLNVLSSETVKELKSNNPDAALTKSNIWFGTNYQRLGIEAKVFYETQPTKMVKIVERDSAMITSLGLNNIPVDANHINIAKPKKGDGIYSTVYKGVRTFIRECLISASNQNP